MIADEDKASEFINSDQFKGEFCRSLAKMGVIHFGITRERGRVFSPYFIDLSPLRSSTNEFKYAVLVLQRILKTEIGAKFKRMVAANVNAIPYVAVMSYSLGVPMLFIKNNDRGGRGRMISGILHSGDHVMLVDEMISTGLTALAATKRLRAEGAIVKDLVVLLEDERGGKERLIKEGIRLHSYMTICEVADQLNQLSIITDAEHRAIHESTKRKP